MIEITDKNFKPEVEEYQGFILLEFYASWCSKCTKGLYALEEWGQKTGCKVGKVELQRNPRLLNEYLSNGLPLYVLFLDGKPQKQKIGITNLIAEFKPLKSDFLTAKKGEKTMVLKFKEACHDKYTNEEFKKGDIKEFEDERAEEILLVQRGRYAEAATEEEALKIKTKTELEEIAEKRGLKAKGNKNDLIKIILEAENVNSREQ